MLISNKAVSISCLHFYLLYNIIPMTCCLTLTINYLLAVNVKVIVCTVCVTTATSQTVLCRRSHPYTPFTRYNRLSNRLYNRFDKRLGVCLHDAVGCSNGCRLYNDGRATGCIV